MPASETLPGRQDAGADGHLAVGGLHRPGPTTRALHQLLGLQTGSAICDVVCGTGRLALSFADEYPDRLVGVDEDPASLEAFRRRAARRSAAVRTVRAAAEELPFPDASFDLVVSGLAAHRFGDVPKAVREMTRLLRPGGRLAVIDLEGHADPAIDALGQELESLRDPGHRRSHLVESWVGFFRGAGLELVAARGGQVESPAGTPVRRWCETAAHSTGAAAIRHRLAGAPAAHREALGIRRCGEEFFVPVRTCLVIGVKPLGGVG
ncbi:class I SAM-dependent methyltransferase [Streptomyces sp. NPDC003635]